MLIRNADYEIKFDLIFSGPKKKLIVIKFLIISHQSVGVINVDYEILSRSTWLIRNMIFNI